MRQQFQLLPEVVEQLSELAQVMHISRASVVSLAIARMHDDEPLLKTNGRRKEKK